MPVSTQPVPLPVSSDKPSLQRAAWQEVLVNCKTRTETAAVYVIRSGFAPCSSFISSHGISGRNAKAAATARACQGYSVKGSPALQMTTEHCPETLQGPSLFQQTE